MKLPKLPKPSSETGRTLKTAIILFIVVMLLAFFFTPGKFFQAWLNPASAGPAAITVSEIVLKTR